METTRLAHKQMELLSFHIDKIDFVHAKYCDSTDEELNSIINYDIKKYPHGPGC